MTIDSEELWAKNGQWAHGLYLSIRIQTFQIFFKLYSWEPLKILILLKLSKLFKIVLKGWNFSVEVIGGSIQIISKEVSIRVQRHCCRLVA